MLEIFMAYTTHSMIGAVLIFLAGIVTMVASGILQEEIDYVYNPTTLRLVATLLCMLFYLGIGTVFVFMLLVGIATTIASM